METCQQDAGLASLEFPAEFEDLEGLVRADLEAIVGMLTGRAHERLFLTRREHGRLQADLWNRLAGVLNESLGPLSIESR